MERIGNDEAGFVVDLDPQVNAVRVTGWGFWDPGVASSFAETVTRACRASPAGRELYLDVTDLKPMRNEGQQSFAELLDVLPSLMVRKTTILTGSPLTKLQLLRITNERKKMDVVNFVTSSDRSGQARV